MSQVFFKKIKYETGWAPPIQLPDLLLIRISICKFALSIEESWFHLYYLLLREYSNREKESFLPDDILYWHSTPVIMEIQLTTNSQALVTPWKENIGKGPRSCCWETMGLIK